VLPCVSCRKGQLLASPTASSIVSLCRAPACLPAGWPPPPASTRLLERSVPDKQACRAANCWQWTRMSPASRRQCGGLLTQHQWPKMSRIASSHRALQRACKAWRMSRRGGERNREAQGALQLVCCNGVMQWLRAEGDSAATACTSFSGSIARVAAERPSLRADWAPAPAEGHTHLLAHSCGFCCTPVQHSRPLAAASTCCGLCSCSGLLTQARCGTCRLHHAEGQAAQGAAEPRRRSRLRVDRAGSRKTLWSPLCDLNGDRALARPTHSFQQASCAGGGHHGGVVQPRSWVSVVRCRQTLQTAPVGPSIHAVHSALARWQQCYIPIVLPLCCVQQRRKYVQFACAVWPHQQCRCTMCSAGETN
jgi:hypothetical protein